MWRPGACKSRMTRSSIAGRTVSRASQQFPVSLELHRRATGCEGSRTEEATHREVLHLRIC